MILAMLLLSQQAIGPTPPEPSPAIQSGTPVPSVVRARIAEQIAAAPKRGGVLSKLLYMPPVSRFYPAASLRAGEQGKAVLHCTLRVTGSLEACSVMLSSGFPALDAASLELMAEARYCPQILNREPTETDVIQPIHWTIED